MIYKPAKLAESDTEEAHQAAVLCWANGNLKLYPELKWLYAIPNGGLRDKITGARLKAQGVKAGVADLFLMSAQCGYHGLYIEMKVGNNAPTEAQLDFAEDAINAGYGWTVCYTWEQAVSVIVDYLEGNMNSERRKAVEVTMGMALSAGTVVSCLNCEYFNQKDYPDKCSIAGVTPPPKIIYYGCEKWEYDIPL